MVLRNTELSSTVSCQGDEVWCATIVLAECYPRPPNDVYNLVDWGVGDHGWTETDRTFEYGGNTCEVRWISLSPQHFDHQAHTSMFDLGFSSSSRPEDKSDKDDAPPLEDEPDKEDPSDKEVDQDKDPLVAGFLGFPSHHDGQT